MSNFSLWITCFYAHAYVLCMVMIFKNSVNVHAAFKLSSMSSCANLQTHTFTVYLQV
jgi:hypothetical protein